MDTGTIYTQVIPHPRPDPILVKKWTQAQSTPKSSPIRDQNQYKWRSGHRHNLHPSHPPSETRPNTSEEVDTGTIYTQVIPHPRPDPILVKKWTQAQSTPKSSPIRDQNQYQWRSGHRHNLHPSHPPSETRPNTSEEVDTGTVYTQVIPHPRPDPILVKKWTQAQSTPKSSPIRDQNQY